MNFLTNNNISLLLFFYYPVFLHCTVTWNFSVLIHYSLFFTLLIFEFCITVCIYLFTLYVCILYFNLFWSCICNFVIIVVTYFTLKFCSKFVLFYINYSWLSVSGQALLVHGADLFISWLLLYPLDELLDMEFLEYY